MIAPAQDELSADAASPDEEADASSHRTASEPYEPLLQAVTEWFSSLEHYWSARTDLVRLHVRKAILTAVLTACAVAAVMMVLAGSIWLLVSGIAGALTEAFGGRNWAGNLSAGLLIPLVLGSVVALGQRLRERASSREKVEQYERRRAAKHESFSQDYVKQNKN